MLRIVLLMLSFSLIIPPIGSSQAIRGYGLMLGAASASQSYNYHDLTYPINLDIDRRWGFDAGAFVEFLNISMVSILSEVHYIQKGYSITLPVTTSDGPDIVGYTTLRPRYDYLSIPLLVKLRYDTDTFAPYLTAGPRFDLYLGQNEDADDISAVIELKETDIGASLGLGTEIPLGAVQALMIEARYSPSFTNVYEGNYLDIVNNSFEFLLGVWF